MRKQLVDKFLAKRLQWKFWTMLTDRLKSKCTSRKTYRNYFLDIIKGQIISKGLFDILEFSQKTYEWILFSSKKEFVRLFFRRIRKYQNVLSKLSDLYRLITKRCRILESWQNIRNCIYEKFVRIIFSPSM